MKLDIINNKQYKIKEHYLYKEINKINYVYIDSFTKELYINKITIFAR